MKNWFAALKTRFEGEAWETFVKIVVASVLLLVAIVLEHTLSLPLWPLLLIYLVPYFVVGAETLHEAVEAIVEGHAFNEDFLMVVATIGALAIGFLPNAEPQFAEAVFVMLFFQVGELFEELAEDRSRRSISQLMDIRPDSAHVDREGIVTAVAPDEVAVDEEILVFPGEKVPLDGIVKDGSSALDTKALTGESAPRDVHEGDMVLSGCVNKSGLLRVRVTKTFSESTVTRILELVENAAERKSKSERFITRFARVYTPIVVGCALLLAFVPPLFSSSFAMTFPTWLYRALIFLVVSCPCALVISVPLTFFSGIGGASKEGILIKGANYVDALAQVHTVVFDKTGTLTHGVFRVSVVHPDRLSEKELLHLAAHVERFSTHPVAAALREAYPEEHDDCLVSEVEEIAGQGVRAVVNGKTVCVGNSRMMEAVGAVWRPCHHEGTLIHVAVEGQYEGHIVISDEVKADAADTMTALRKQGVKHIVMLTGDRKTVAEGVAKQLDVDDYRAELLPADKVDIVEGLRNACTENRSLLFVGDGINDAPVLARADVGVAMGALGSDAAVEAADVVLMDDQPHKIATAIALARRTRRIASQNIVFAIVVKVLVLLLSAFGVAQMGLAVFADVGVMVLAVLNAMRASNVNLSSVS